MSDLNAFNLDPGQAVGGYVLISRLGSGAMGSVWRVRDEGGQQYAMKILRDSFADDSGAAGTGTGEDDESQRDRVTARERLRREAMALRRIKHPGVCGIVDMELDDSLAFIVTELIEGKNLQADVAANGRYIGDDLERLARKLTDAVGAVHAAGIIHRDIKPTNVMIAATGPVLVDFGIAMGEGENHVTRTGLVMGTPGFIAPEVVDGVESDEQTDWWSTASVLAFAATGKPVFGIKPMMAVLERAAAGNASLPGLPPRTQEAFRSALDPDRSRRCTPAALLQAIAEDAAAPGGWGAPGNTGSAAGDLTKPIAPANGANGVVRPFDAGDSPRTMWLDAPDSASQTQRFAPTTTLTAKTSGTAPTAALPEGGELTAVMPSSATQPLSPQTQVLEPQVLEPQVLEPQVLEPHTQILAPAIPAQPAAIVPKARGTAPPDRQPEPYAPQPAAAPTDAAANPTDIRRGAYLSGGKMPVCLAAALLAPLTALMPLIGICTAFVVIWILLALGYNVQSQLDREARRGGLRKTTDTALRAAAFPWHLIKALAGAVPRALLYAAIAMGATLLISMALSLPAGSVRLQIAGWALPLRLLTDQPLSHSGLVLGGCTVIAWLITVFGPHSMLVRLGAGALRGLKSMDADQHRQAAESSEIESSVGNRHRGWRGAALVVIWLVSTVAVFTVAATSGQIDWSPLPTPGI